MLRSLLRRTTVTAACAGLLWTAVPAHAQPTHPARPHPVSPTAWADRASFAVNARLAYRDHGQDQHGLYLERTPRQSTDPEHS